MAAPAGSSPSQETLPAKSLIGMVHVGALPGTPRHADPVEALVRRAVADARAIEAAGFDALIIENMHDTPYVHGEALGPEVVACMTTIAAAVADAVDVAVGVQILSGGNRHAVAVAHAVGGAFIRCENFVFGHIADEGLLERAEAGPLLRYRRQIGAGGVAVFADIKKKHASHALTADVPIEAAAEAAAYFGADGVIVTGAWTGRSVDLDELRRVASVAGVPVLVGSGVTPDSATALLRIADGLIVGSWIKAGGQWRNPVDPDRAAALVKSARVAGST